MDERRQPGRPRGSGARYVRVCFHVGRSYNVHIGRALWYEAGSPERVMLRRDRGAAPTLLYLVPCDAPRGYRVTQSPAPGLGMPRISVGRAIALELGLLPGRFAGRQERGEIVVDLAWPVLR